LRLADINGLERERVRVSSPDRTAETLRQHGATQQEIDILVGGERVELNALTSDQLVVLIERKLAKHGIRKVIPNDETLAHAYQRMRRLAAIQKKIDELVDELDERVKVPAGLRPRITKALKVDPTRPWDAVMREIADEDQDDE